MVGQQLVNQVDVRQDHTAAAVSLEAKVVHCISAQVSRRISCWTAGRLRCSLANWKAHLHWLLSVDKHHHVAFILVADDLQLSFRENGS